LLGILAEVWPAIGVVVLGAFLADQDTARSSMSASPRSVGLTAISRPHRDQS
jgi:hypothetical protein